MRQLALLLYARAYYACTFRARTHYTYARAHPRENAHAHAHDAFERARTDTHAPWHVWADHARTHASAHEHACMHAHAHALRTHARTLMHAPAQCSCMHTHAHARTHLHMRTHSCNHLQFGCALTDWGHTPQLWFVFGKTLSLFGCLALSFLDCRLEGRVRLHAYGLKGPALVLPGNPKLFVPPTAWIPPLHDRTLCTFPPCITLNWPRLRRQRQWLRLGGLTGCYQWEWSRSLIPPAGLAMPCTKLLSLPPPCGSLGQLEDFSSVECVS